MASQQLSDAERAARDLMTTGGDARITLDPATGANRYHAAPQPRDVLAYASSTANDMSRAAFEHVVRVSKQLPGYAEGLEALRGRIRAAYGVPASTHVVFAPSGTDLEYVALAECLGRAPNGVHNILLGADEVGSGCIHSAHGAFFARETALGAAVEPGQDVPGLGEHVSMVDIPVRDEQGHTFTSASIREQIDAAVRAAKAEGRHALVHVVHGSKTGLILPVLDDIDSLGREHGEAMSLVVDACQARITSAAIADYLKRGAIVFLTGSKFMGGPPFSGFALLPAGIERPPLPEGFAQIFRRAEWPAGWPGAERLEDSANPGLLLRIEASVFELERFQRLSLERVTRVILAFHAAVRTAMVERLGGRRVAPYPPGERAEGDAHPIEMRTLSTIDLSHRPSAPDFEEAQQLHKALVDEGIRLGQPVKCVRLPDGRWGATLRLGLSMPQVVEMDALDDRALHARLAADMDRIASAIERLG